MEPLKVLPRKTHGNAVYILNTGGGLGNIYLIGKSLDSK